MTIGWNLNKKMVFPRSQLWPTTAAIGDFDNDGFGDIALGWFNPEISHFMVSMRIAQVLFI